MGLENGQISLDNYNHEINNFLLKVLNNNSNNNIKGQPRPIMIFYMISSIFKNVAQFLGLKNSYFDHTYKN